MPAIAPNSAVSTRCTLVAIRSHRSVRSKCAARAPKRHAQEHRLRLQRQRQCCEAVNTTADVRASQRRLPHERRSADWLASNHEAVRTVPDAHGHNSLGGGSSIGGAVHAAHAELDAHARGATERVDVVGAGANERRRK
jgi:hypothetical protein